MNASHGHDLGKPAYLADAFPADRIIPRKHAMPIRKPVLAFKEAKSGVHSARLTTCSLCSSTITWTICPTNAETHSREARPCAWRCIGDIVNSLRAGSITPFGTVCQAQNPIVYYTLGFCRSTTGCNLPHLQAFNAYQLQAAICGASV